MDDYDPDFTPDTERKIRRALHDAHNTDLINEAYRVIGREKWELRERLRISYERSSLVESVLSHYAERGNSAAFDRRELLHRLNLANARRVLERDNRQKLRGLHSA